MNSPEQAPQSTGELTIENLDPKEYQDTEILDSKEKEPQPTGLFKKILGHFGVGECVELTSVSPERGKTEKRGKLLLDMFSGGRLEYKNVYDKEVIARTEAIQEVFGNDISLHYFQGPDSSVLSKLAGFSFDDKFNESHPVIAKAREGIDIFIDDSLPNDEKINTELHELCHAKMKDSIIFELLKMEAGQNLTVPESVAFSKEYNRGYSDWDAPEEFAVRFFADMQTHKDFWDELKQTAKDPQKIDKYIEKMGFDFEKPRNEKIDANIFKPGTKQNQKMRNELIYLMKRYF